MIYVVARNYGHGEYGLPYIAFNDKATALRWVACQFESFSVAEVPVFPEFPLKDWARLETVTE